MGTRAETQGTFCQQITSVEKGDSYIVKTFKCETTRRKVAAQDNRGAQMDPSLPKSLSGIDNFGWPYSSLHAALEDSSTIQ